MEQEVLSFAAEELQRYCRLMDAQGVPEIALSVEAAVCPADGDPALDDAYRIAVENRYRFFSFGDAMYIGDTKERGNLCLNC